MLTGEVWSEQTVQAVGDRHWRSVQVHVVAEEKEICCPQCLERTRRKVRGAQGTEGAGHRPQGLEWPSQRGRKVGQMDFFWLFTLKYDYKQDI